MPLLLHQAASAAAAYLHLRHAAMTNNPPARVTLRFIQAPHIPNSAASTSYHPLSGAVPSKQQHASASSSGSSTSSRGYLIPQPVTLNALKTATMELIQQQEPALAQLLQLAKAKRKAARAQLKAARAAAAGKKRRDGAGSSSDSNVANGATGGAASSPPDAGDSSKDPYDSEDEKEDGGQ